MLHSIDAPNKKENVFNAVFIIKDKIIAMFRKII